MNDNTDNVISLGTRKLLVVEQAEQAAVVAAIAEQQDADKLEAKGKMLDAIDKLRDYIEEGRCGGLIFMTQETATGLFLSDVILPKAIVPTNQLFAWAGLISGIAAEMGEYATMTPQLLMDGSVSDPNLIQVQQYEAEYED